MGWPKGVPRKGYRVGDLAKMRKCQLWFPWANATHRKGHGQSSETTPYKETIFSVLMTLIYQHQFPRPSSDRPFVHIDLNAGDGFNQKVGTKGSPLAAAERLPVAFGDFVAYFVDVSARAVATLKTFREIRLDGRMRTIVEDNKKFLSESAPILLRHHGDRRALGLVMCDPNGVRAFPARELRNFAGRYPEFSLLIYWNDMPKRLRCYAAAPGPSRAPANLSRENIREKVPISTMQSFMESCNRKNWYIKRLPGKERFVILGTNITKNLHWEAAEIYNTKTEHGRALVLLADTTKEERRAVAKPQFPRAVSQ